MEDKRHPEDYCHNCGADNICWYAPNEIFNSVTGTHGEGIMCPQCFMKMADAKGMKIIFTVEDFNNRGTAKDQELSLLTEKYNKLKEAFDWIDKRIIECEDRLTWEDEDSGAERQKRYGVEQELNTLKRIKNLAGLKEQ